MGCGEQTLSPQPLTSDDSAQAGSSGAGGDAVCLATSRCDSLDIPLPITIYILYLPSNLFVIFFPSFLRFILSFFLPPRCYELPHTNWNPLKPLSVP